MARRERIIRNLCARLSALDESEPEVRRFNDLLAVGDVEACAVLANLFRAIEQLVELIARPVH